MGLNAFDDAAEQLSDSPNPFDGVVQSRFGEGEARLKGAAQQAAATTPETAAEASRVASRLGLPVPVVARNLDAMKKRAESQDTPYARMMRETPKLADWLQQPENFAVSKDDHPVLGQLEWLVSAPSRAFAQTMNQQAYSRLRFKSLFGDLTQDERDQMNAYKFHAELGGDLGADTWWKQAITGAGSFLANQVPVAKYAAAGAAEVGAAGAAAGSILPGAGTLAGLATGAAVGGSAGALYGVMRSTFEQETAGAFDEFSDFRDELGRPLDPTVARVAALAVGAINAPIEAGAQELLLRSIPGLDKLSTTAVRSGVKRALLNPTVRAALFDAVKSYGTTLAGETAQEVAQRAVTILSGELAKTAANVGAAAAGSPARFEHRGAADVASELGSEAVSAAAGFALGVGAGPSLRMARAVQEARASQQLLTEIGQAAASSKTVQRLPEAAQSFIAQATKDGPTETVYAPVATFTEYWQSKGVDPASVAEELTGDAQAYAQAVRTGEDLAIPMAAYAVRVAPTEHNAFFAQELRLSPERMNAREAEAFAASMQEQAATADATADVEAPGEPSSSERVRTLLLGQLEAAGVPKPVAEGYAQLYASTFETLGQRAGVDPAQLFESYGLTVGRESLDMAPQPAQTASVSNGVSSVPQEAAAAISDSEYDSTATTAGAGSGTGWDAAIRRVDASLAPEPVFVQRDGTRGYFKRESVRDRTARREQHYADVRSAVLDAARRVDPSVDPAEVSAALDERLAYLEEADRDYQEAGHNPRQLLEAIAGYGGLSLKVERGGYVGELKWVLESPASGAYGAFAGVRGVFRERSVNADGQAESGLSLDDMARMLSQDPQFGIDNIDTLLAALEDVSRLGDVGAKGAVNFPGTRELQRRAGVDLSRAWWRGGEDVSFNPDEFNQGPKPSAEYLAALEQSRVASAAFSEATRAYRAQEIGDAEYLAARKANDAASAAFDAAYSAEQSREPAMAERVDAPPAPSLFDTLDTGEQQPRLPGAEDVRNVENKTPAFDAPFSLTPEAKKSKRVKQTTLFQAFFQEEPNDKRGAMRIGPDGRIAIALFEKADLSTFLHESGHFFLEVLGDLNEQIAAADPDVLTPEMRQMALDYATLLEWFGVESREGVGRDQHEQFARGVEAYLMEGLAPSSAMRGVFARFRSWLVGVYRSIRALDVQLTPEVRRVFDRLIASDAAIAQAEREAKLEPLFATPEDAGMTPAEFARYRDVVTKASEAAREELYDRALDDLRREQKQWWKDERDAMRVAVTEELSAQPVYRAWFAMAKGTNPDGSFFEGETAARPMKLRGSDVKGRYAPEQVDVLRRRRLYAATDGEPAFYLAELFGFSSSDELVLALAAAKPLKQAVEAETEIRMQQKYGDMLLSGEVYEKAQAAVLEGREAIVEAELKALWKRQRDVQPFVDEGRAQQAKDDERERAYERRWLEAEAKLRIAIAEGYKQVEIDALRAEVKRLKAQTRGGATVIRAALPSTEDVRRAAAERVARMSVRRLQPMKFFTAAQRASQAATEAAARGQFGDAIQAKQQELVNLALYRQSMRAKDEAQAIAERMRGTQRAAYRKRLGKAGADYLQQIDGFVDRYEFAAVSLKALDRRESLRAWASALEAQGLPVDLPESVLDDVNRVNWREISLEELRGVNEAIRQIEHLARLKNRLLTSATERAFDEAVDSLVSSIAEHNAAKPLPLEFTPKDEKARRLARWAASHTKLSTFVRAFDGYQDGGAMWDTILRPINDAATREAAMKADAARAFHDLFTEHYSGRDASKMSEQAYLPQIGGSLSKEARIAIALNWGNEGNRQRIRDGRQWSDEQVRAILDTLDERDWRFVQGVWNLIDSYWPAIVAKQKRVVGVAPEKVEPTEVRTKFGTFAGGYYPLVYDGRLSARASSIAEAGEANLQKQAAYVKATTRRGHTEARVANVRQPVRLEISVIGQHLEQVIHDLTHHEMLIDVGRLLGDKRVQEAMYQTKGDIVYQQFKDALKDIAYGTQRPASMVESALNTARAHVVIAGLGWNVWTSLQQPTGLINGMQRVGAKWVMRGIYRSLRDSESQEATAKWIYERSDMMRMRGQTQQREVYELRGTLIREGSWFDNALRTVTLDKVQRADIESSFFMLIEFAQRIADIPTWRGAYEKALEAGESDDRAVALADQAVLDSQGGGQIKDLAQVQRGGPALKLFTTFYSYGNLLYNQTSEAYGRTNFRKPRSIGEFLVSLSMIYVWPAVVSLALAQAVGRDDGDDEPWVVELGREVLGQAMNTMLVVREFGGLLRASNRGYEGPTGTRFISTAYGLGQQAMQGELDRGLYKSATDTLGFVVGIPASQIQRSIDGFMALRDGRTSNPAALLVGAPRKAS